MCAFTYTRRPHLKHHPLLHPTKECIFKVRVFFDPLRFVPPLETILFQTVLSGVSFFYPTRGHRRSLYFEISLCFVTKYAKRSAQRKFISQTTLCILTRLILTLRNALFLILMYLVTAKGYLLT